MPSEPMPLATEPTLVVAADFPAGEQALALADRLSGLPVWLKVGLELFTSQGPPLIHLLADRGFAVFLDLKFHDIPNTVQGAVRSATLLGARMITLHLAGGEAMCRAAMVGRAEALSAVRAGAGELAPPLLIGVTVLTSEAGNEETLRSRVVKQAHMARDWGLDGVVCSGLEAAAVKAGLGPKFLCVCPGIRFAGTRSDDQARICTPAEAAAAGADYLVMGRPLIRAENPRAATEHALADIQKGWEEARAGQSG